MLFLGSHFMNCISFLVRWEQEFYLGALKGISVFHNSSSSFPLLKSVFKFVLCPQPCYCALNNSCS